MQGDFGDEKMIIATILIILFIGISILAYQNITKFWDECVYADLEKIKNKKQNPWEDDRLK